MNIHSDKISEKFRKYVVRLILDDNKKVYLMWGTDQGNEDMDYLLTDDKNKILAFYEISVLKKYVNTRELQIDPSNTKKWGKLYNETQPYTEYNLLEIKNILKVSFNLDELQKHDALLMSNFINLFSDYAYQVGKTSLVGTINSRQIKIFQDYALGKFFWDASDQSKPLSILAKKFDFAIFKNSQLKMIELFKNSLVYIPVVL